MKKTALMLAAALSLGTVAIAQTPDASMSAQPPAATPDASGNMAPGMNPGMTPPAGGDAMAPAPAATPDASAPAPAGSMPSGSGMPSTGMQPSGGMSGGNMTTPTPVDSASLPACSRTVTDKCMQKGGTAKGRMAHYRMAKKKG